VGGTETVKVDVRILAATNRDLKREVSEGRFREDLYYRLNVILVEVPPLRDRLGDLPELVRHFLQKMNEKRPTRFEGITPEALKVLGTHRWPGNVRELENMIERVVTLYDDTMIRPEHLPEDMGPQDANASARAGAPGSVVLRGGKLSDMEREAIQQALKDSRYNKKRAAEVLGISRPTLYQKIRRYGLEQGV
jgi:transcriptional regulator with PAS, ATPase and Fis domain